MRGGAWLKPFDLVILMMAIGLTALSAWLVYGPAAGANTARQVIIEGSDQTWVYPLKSEETIQVTGPLGITIVEIHDGHAHIEQSPCKNQTCVSSGSISRPGDWIACLPNSVFVRIEGSEQEGGVDAATW